MKNILITAIGSMSFEGVIKTLKSYGVSKIVGCDINDSEYLYPSKQVDTFYKVSKALNPKDTQDMLSKFINNDNSSKQDKNINELPPVYIRDQNGDQDFKNKKVIDNSETFPQFIN